MTGIHNDKKTSKDSNKKQNKKTGNNLCSKQITCIGKITVHLKQKVEKKRLEALDNNKTTIEKN